MPDRGLSDFGRIVHRRPSAIVRAEREEHIVSALSMARSQGIPLTIRGTGHSCNGQSVTDGVVVVNVPNPSTPPRLLEDGLVEVLARSRWRQVEAFLNGHGRSIPVLADYLDLSVGGTLSVGGYGADSVIHGAQVDHVERIRLITPDGTAMWCSSHENAELFAYALGGLGQVGVIERAVLRTVPYRPLTTIFTCRHSSLRELIESIGWLAGSPSESPTLFKALHSRGRFLSTYGVHSATVREALSARRHPPLRGCAVARTLTTPRYRQLRSVAVALWLARWPTHRRLWSDYLFDYEGLKGFEAFLRPLLNEDAFFGCLTSVYIVAVRKLPRAVSFPFEASEATREPMSFGIGLYSMISKRQPDLVGRVAETASRCLEKCVELGGRPYLYGWHRMNEHVGRALYGPAYDRLLELRRQLDADDLFQPHKLLAVDSPECIGGSGRGG